MRAGACSSCLSLSSLSRDGLSYVGNVCAAADNPVEGPGVAGVIVRLEPVLVFGKESGPGVLKGAEETAFSQA